MFKSMFFTCFHFVLLHVAQFLYQTGHMNELIHLNEWLPRLACCPVFLVDWTHEWIRRFITQKYSWSVVFLLNLVENKMIDVSVCWKLSRFCEILKVEIWRTGNLHMSRFFFFVTVMILPPDTDIHPCTYKADVESIHASVGVFRVYVCTPEMLVALSWCKIANVLFSWDTCSSRELFYIAWGTSLLKALEGGQNTTKR